MKLELDIPETEIVVCVRIPGEPQAWLRSGRDGKRTFNPKPNADARDHVRWVIKAKHPQFPDHMDCVNRFGLAAIFETAMFTTDGDNYLKQLLDALNGFVVKNDRQFDDYFVRVYRGAEKPNQQVIVWRGLSPFAGRQI
ncbi:MAG: RusA family crossover junction endodeoxyribonuclease [Candidatus Acidiferrum sp.]